MSHENYGSNRTIDHCYPLSKTISFKELDVFKSPTCVNLRTKYINENSSKGAEINHCFHLLQ